ncbi:hypothetical protein [Desulfovibrio gilichinskyi]|uniref:hypothetical protein n=1 Tax=Desulfovibrio gilichinskyi TaxID=1519643 RepID=UPI0014832DCA|nr:hypothetical protein [Desulfovibrio gilichinskyi]
MRANSYGLAESRSHYPEPRKPIIRSFIGILDDNLISALAISFLHDSSPDLDLFKWKESPSRQTS